MNERLLFLHESDITQSKLYDMVPARVCGTVDYYDGVYVTVYDRGRDLYLTVRRKQCAVLVEYRLSDDQCGDSDCDYVCDRGQCDRQPVSWSGTGKAGTGGTDGICRDRRADQHGVCGPGHSF